MLVVALFSVLAGFCDSIFSGQKTRGGKGLQYHGIGVARCYSCPILGKIEVLCDVVW